MENNENHIGNSVNDSSSSSFSEIRNGIKDIFKSLSDITDSLRKKITFKEYLDATSEYIDEQVIRISDKEELSFVAGNCIIACPSPCTHLSIHVELFFKNVNDQWIKKELDGQVKVVVFKPEALKNEIEMLKRQSLKIALNPPKCK